MSAVQPVVLVHGGAGDVPESMRARHQEGAQNAADLGLRVLHAGGSALDAVVAAVSALEDDPVFNAGTGACLTERGTLELDASIMRGSDLALGAVTVLPPFKNPIQVARAVLENGKHVFYAAEGARDFALAHGFAEASLSDMRTDDAVRRLELVLAGKTTTNWAGGTVGAVACDAVGRVAAATSTGGTVGKKCGRVGDTPVVGAGTYADDELGACSATGVGEAILRSTLTRTACELLRRSASVEEAASRALRTFETRVHGSGGIILVNTRGEIAAPFNTKTMTHAWAR